jgi:hypothetical protein
MYLLTVNIYSTVRTRWYFDPHFDFSMADVAASNGLASQQAAEKTPFEKQQDLLIGQITQVSR